MPVFSKIISAFLIIIAPVLYAFSGITNTVELDFQKIDLAKGDQNVVLKINKKTNWEFKLAVPEFEADEKRPLVIALHWSGEEGTYEEFSECLMEPGLEAINAFLVSPDGDNMTWDSRSNVDKIVNIVEMAKKHWPVDPDKILITGYSDGGNATWYFAGEHSSLFTAAIPIASSFKVRNNKIIPMPIFVIHGTNDDYFPVSQTLNYAQKALSEGNNIEFYAAEGLSHFTPCEYESHLNQAVKWLKKTAWKRSD